MDAHAAVIQRLYESFQNQDAAGMAACYHAEAVFNDPVFKDLRGAQIGAMWDMLLSRASDLTIRFSDVQADGDRGSARWEADYPFSQTGRMVRNKIAAQFEFKDGLIVRHTDTFDLWKWTRMALGPTGLLLGWTPMVQGKVRAQARRALEKHMKRTEAVL